MAQTHERLEYISSTLIDGERIIDGYFDIGLFEKIKDFILSITFALSSYRVGYLDAEYGTVSRIGVAFISAYDFVEKRIKKMNEEG